MQKAAREDPTAGPVKNVALLFENVEGAHPRRQPIPLAMNVFGTERRLCLALGLKNLDEIGERIGDLLKPELPHGVSGSASDALGKAAQLSPCRRSR